MSAASTATVLGLQAKTLSVFELQRPLFAKAAETIELQSSQLHSRSWHVAESLAAI
jgi:hypothetical protein